MNREAQLVLRHDPTKVAVLHRDRPTTIGRAADNRLRLASSSGVAEHHAVVRFSRRHGWLVCDWQSRDGTYLEGERIRQCRRLQDGDEIQLGGRGPVLVFRLPAGDPAAPAAAGGDAALRDAAARGALTPGAAMAAASGSDRRPPATPPVAPATAAARPGPAPPGHGPSPVAEPGLQGVVAAAAATGPRRSRSAAGSAGAPAAGAPLILAGRSIPLAQIRSAHVRSRQRHPNSFSWWVLLCLGGMVLLPIPWLFWSVQIAALVAWILLGSRKEHELVVTLRDGMAYRHGFASRLTALSHRNGIRKAIGQSLEAT
ncbi:MAG: FHA domain-containing protein [Synechococcus sp.]|nr:FHA domain-containing protein [Synechococcus sp.]